MKTIERAFMFCHGHWAVPMAANISGKQPWIGFGTKDIKTLFVDSDQLIPVSPNSQIHRFVKIVESNNFIRNVEKII